MAMTVKDLIKELQQHPSDMQVAVAAFDHGEDEIAGLVSGLHELKDGEMKDHYGPCLVISG